MNNLIELGKKNNIDIEIFKEKNKSTDISTLNDKIKLFQITDVTSYVIKAIKENKCIKIVTENLNNPKEIITKLNEIFSITDNKNKNKLCTGKLVNKVNEFEKLNLKDVKDDLLSLNNLRSAYSCIKTIEAEFSHVESNNLIKNAVNNCDMEDETYLNYYGAALTVEKNNISRVLYISYYTKNYNFEEFKNYLLKRLEYLIIKLNYKSVKTDKYRVLLTNNVVQNILATFSDSFQSRGIYLKNSVLTDKLNCKIFSDKISIMEDSPNGLVNSNFDSEGTIKNKQIIVNKGIFCNEINNLEYAIKLDKEPTGNADGVNNLYIVPGNKPFDELVSLLKNGIIIDEAYGFHAGVDKKTGNISVQAEGLFVENGKITYGLNMIILSTNLFEVFSNVCEIGNDLSKTSINVCAPSILLENITITGKE